MIRNLCDATQLHSMLNELTELGFYYRLASETNSVFGDFIVFGLNKELLQVENSNQVLNILKDAELITLLYGHPALYTVRSLQELRAYIDGCKYGKNLNDK